MKSSNIWFSSAICLTVSHSNGALRTKNRASVWDNSGRRSRSRYVPTRSAAWIIEKPTCARRAVGISRQIAICASSTSATAPAICRFCRSLNATSHAPFAVRRLPSPVIPHSALISASPAGPPPAAKWPGPPPLCSSAASRPARRCARRLSPGWCLRQSRCPARSRR